MCLLIFHPRDAGRLEIDDFADYTSINSDGFSITRVVDGKIEVYRSNALDEDYMNYIRYALGHDCILHWRMATHGTVTIENAHPFEIAPSLYMAHNGILDWPIEQKDKSDTWHYVRDFLRPRYSDGREFLLDSATERAMLTHHIGDENRMVFARSDGFFFIIGARRGVWYRNMWYSNLYAWTITEDMALDMMWKN